MIRLYREFFLKSFFVTISFFFSFTFFSSYSYALTIGLSPEEAEQEKIAELEATLDPLDIPSRNKINGLDFQSDGDKADPPPILTRDGKLIIVVSNDAFSFNMSDRHLTSRLRVGYISRHIPKYLKSYIDSKNYFIMTLSQDIYTPDDLENAEWIEGDRPYAGWLYLTLGKMRQTQKSIVITTLDIGIVGPSARAEEVQSRFHKWTGSSDPLGWPHQLADELGVNVNHQKMFRDQFMLTQMVSAELLKFYGGKLGNIRTSLSVGTMGRLGYNLPNDFGIGFQGVENSNWTIFGYVKVEGEYVLKDIFLDGNTYKQSHSVEKENFIADLTAGLTVQKGNWGASIYQTLRTEEFEGQEGGDSFAELQVFYNFYYR